MVALWLSNMVDLLDPDVIVIGGGAAALLDFAILEERVPEFSVNPRASEVGIVHARYGADSGIAGGAALCA
jgi:predicted NBD/HSP70 family sugar kinase